MTTATHPMFEIGEQARDEGRLDDAERAFRAVLAEEPENFGALYNLGKLLWDRSQPQNAVPLLEEAARHAPQQPRLQLSLARTLNRLGRYEAAEELCGQLLTQQPDQADARVLLGQLLARRGEAEDAVEHWSRALNDQPGHPRASIELARSLMTLNYPGKARRIIQAARDQRPHMPALKVEHAAILIELQEYGVALELLEAVPEKAPVFPASVAHRAEIHLALDQPEKALEILQAHDLDQPPVLLAHARTYRALEQPVEAANRLRSLLARFPNHRRAWEELCHVSPEAISNRDLQKLKKIRRNASGIMRIRFGFALARVGHAREDYAGEQSLLDEANAEQRELEPYSRDRLERFHQSLREGLDPDRLPASGDDAGHEPVFLLGMPFSGTGLVENLLREQGRPALGSSTLLRSILNNLVPHFAREDILDLVSRPPEELGNTFVRGARQWVAEKAGIGSGPWVERNWISFQYLPLLRAAFPNARFVQVRREPRDLVVANYRHRFEQGHAYSYNLEDTAHMLGEHERMIRHWRDRGLEIAELALEDLVRDPAGSLNGIGLAVDAETAEQSRGPRSWRDTIGVAGTYSQWRETLDRSLERFGVE